MKNESRENKINQLMFGLVSIISGWFANVGDFFGGFWAEIVDTNWWWVAAIAILIVGGFVIARIIKRRSRGKFGIGQNGIEADVKTKLSWRVITIIGIVSGMGLYLILIYL